MHIVTAFPIIHHPLPFCSRSDKASFGRSAGRGAVIKETVTAAAWPTVRASPTARSKHIRHLHFNPLYGDGAAGNAQGTPPEGSISDKVRATMLLIGR